MERRAAPWGHRYRAAMFFSGDLVGVGLQLAGQGQQLRGEQKPVCLSACLSVAMSSLQQCQVCAAPGRVQQLLLMLAGASMLHQRLLHGRMAGQAAGPACCRFCALAGWSFLSGFQMKASRCG